MNQNIRDKKKLQVAELHDEKGDHQANST
jgi:hypothetical protein